MNMKKILDWIRINEDSYLYWFLNKTVHVLCRLINKPISEAGFLEFYLQPLYEDRYSNERIERAIDNANKRFPNVESIFLLTDRKKSFVDLRVTLVEMSDIYDVINENLDSITIFVWAFNSDEKAVNTVNILNAYDNVYYFGAHCLYPPTRYLHTNDYAKKSITKSFETLEKGGTSVLYLGDSENLLQCVEDTSRLDGDYVEIGVYKGKSALVALDYMRLTHDDRRCYFFDLFEGFNQESSKISSDALYYNTHSDTSIEGVKDLLKKYENIDVQKLDIVQEELPEKIENISFAHIDVDIYEAVLASMLKVDGKLLNGGIMAIEDYGHTPLIIGAIAAVKEFLSQTSSYYTSIYL